jgi:hypothetical protein
MRSPSRRRLLGSLGALAGVAAGCLGSPGTGSQPTADAGSDGTATTTGSTDAPRVVAPGTTVETDDGTVTVSAPRLRKLALLDSGIWGDVRAADGQFLLVDVEIDGTAFGEDFEALRSLPLSASVDGSIVDDDPRIVAVVPPGQPPDDPENFQRHAIGFDVPTGTADAAAVVRRDEPRVRWQLDAPVRDHLGAAPDYELEDLAFTPDDEGVIEASVTVSNVGDRDGTWLAQFSVQHANDDSDVVGFRVPAGETISRTVRPPILGAAVGGYKPGRTVTVQFRSHTSLEREVTVPEITGTSTPPGD